MAASGEEHGLTNTQAALFVSIAIVLGTRPEIIKLAPFVRACEQCGAPFYIVHSGQHYSPEMDAVFFQQLNLPAPRYALAIGSGSHGAQTGRMLEAIERVFLEERPDAVIVEGDTNTVLAAALAAVKLHIPVGHVEAGLRSCDRTMPEEHNRVATDHLSDWLFAPTEQAAATLRSEGIPSERVFLTGNTIVDAVMQNRPLAEARSDALARLGLTRRNYVLATVHRQENVDCRERFSGILAGLAAVGAQLGWPVLYPIHPRSRKMLGALELRTDGVRLCEPLNYLDFLQLEGNAALVVTDSGGVQEETCILGVPCVTVRDNTERPETVESGSNILAGADAARIVAACMAQASRSFQSAHPYGDGLAASRIVSIVCDRLSQNA